MPLIWEKFGDSEQRRNMIHLFQSLWLLFEERRDGAGRTVGAVT